MTVNDLDSNELDKLKVETVGNLRRYCESYKVGSQLTDNDLDSIADRMIDRARSEETDTQWCDFYWVTALIREALTEEEA